MAMSRPRVDYDRLAPHYDERYAAGPPSGISETLQRLVSSLAAVRVLEVGCGTGQWLCELRASAPQLYGLDPSSGMLTQARSGAGRFRLIRGRGEQLPLQPQAFDLVFCVNAIHHFDEPGRFVAEARRVLRDRGALCVIGMDPRADRDRWCVYDYFPGTREVDLQRYPAAGTIADWMRAAGFATIESGIAHRILETRVGPAVLADPILQKNGTSQLALLSQEAYDAGIARIRAALTENAETIFTADISLAMTVGYVSRSR
jgi:SAM-dependent methyltransferase